MAANKTNGLLLISRSDLVIIILGIRQCACGNKDVVEISMIL